MLRAFSTAATGMAAQQTIVDVIANNLANINTTGFKRSQVSFQDLMYIKLRISGGDTSTGGTPTGLEIGSGVRPAATLKVFTQGELENTGRSLDVAILGDGFFQVTDPGGATKYTRDGALSVDANGNLVTTSGHRVGSINIPTTDVVGVSIYKDGTVIAHKSDGTESNVGQITLARFANPAGLSSEGDNLYAETSASGSPISATPGENGAGMLQQRFLEKGNVQMVTELVNLITAQRAYEINARAIKAGDEMLTTANRLIM